MKFGRLGEPGNCRFPLTPAFDGIFDLALFPRGRGNRRFTWDMMRHIAGQGTTSGRSRHLS